MSQRSRAREVVFQVLYQDDLNPAARPSDRDEFLRQRLRGTLIPFAQELVRGVRQNRPEIDEKLAAAAEHWSLSRMAATDRNILRLGAYEILHADTPDRVAIDEALELAKCYGTAQSARFVNGVLDRVMHQKSTVDPQPSAPPPPSPNP